MRLVVTLLTLVALVFALASSWRHNGQNFQIPFPSAITATNDMGVPITPGVLTITFPKLFPGELLHELPRITTLGVGDIVEIDMTSPMVEDWARSNRSFRVSVNVNSAVSSSYFFYADTNIPEDARVVRLRITNNDKPAGAFHQIDSHRGGPWYWLREYYNVQVLEIT